MIHQNECNICQQNPNVCSRHQTRQPGNLHERFAHIDQNRKEIVDAAVAERSAARFATDEQMNAYNKDLTDDAESLQKAWLEQATAPKRDIYAYFRAKQPEGFSTYIGPVFDKDKLFQLLVTSVCPVVCKGYRVPETIDSNGYKSDDWHELCENTAHRAMKELGYE